MSRNLKIIKLLRWRVDGKKIDVSSSFSSMQYIGETMMTILLPSLVSNGTHVLFTRPIDRFFSACNSTTHKNPSPYGSASSELRSSNLYSKIPNISVLCTVPSFVFFPNFIIFTHPEASSLNPNTQLLDSLLRRNSPLTPLLQNA